MRRGSRKLEEKGTKEKTTRKGDFKTEERRKRRRKGETVKWERKNTRKRNQNK